MIQVIDGEIKQYRLPKTGTLKNGTTVSGYDSLPLATLKSEGWLTLEDNPPEYDANSQYLVPNYIIYEDRVVKEYEIKQIQKSEFEIIIEEIRDLILAKDLTEEEMLEKINIYPDWEDIKLGSMIEEKTILKYQGNLYQVITGKSHNKQLDRSPLVESLFYKIVPPDVIPNWEQRYGHNPYSVGQKVVASDGNIYELILANWMGYEPPNQGWKKI